MMVGRPRTGCVRSVAEAIGKTSSTAVDRDGPKAAGKVCTRPRMHFAETRQIRFLRVVAPLPLPIPLFPHHAGGGIGIRASTWPRSIVARHVLDPAGSALLQGIKAPFLGPRPPFSAAQGTLVFPVFPPTENLVNRNGRLELRAPLPDPSGNYQPKSNVGRQSIFGHWRQIG